MGRILSLMNEKGGVGKSSLTFSVAWRLAELGRRVLMVDLDGQMANLTYVAGVPQEGCQTMADVLLRNVPLEQVIVPVSQSPKELLFLVPANTSMADALTTAKISRMKKAIASIRDAYDYIFLDVNPAPDWKHALTLSVLDCVAIVMLPDVLSLEANRGIIESIQEVQETMNPELKIAGLILNRYDSWTNLSRAVTGKALQMAQILQTSVFDTKVRKAVAMSESVFDHIGVTAYAPKSEVANDICKLTEELMEKIQG